MSAEQKQLLFSPATPHKKIKTPRLGVTDLCRHRFEMGRAHTWECSQLESYCGTPARTYGQVGIYENIKKIKGRIRLRGKKE